jgi:hypothetical protein
VSYDNEVKYGRMLEIGYETGSKMSNVGFSEPI